MSRSGPRLLVGIVALAAAVVLFVVLQGGDDGGSSEQHSFSFKVAGGTVAGGEQAMEVSKGDRVTLTLSPDVPSQLHVHGYELEKRVGSGRTGSLTFTADAEGEYEVEAHHLVHGEEAEAVELGTLSVNP
jgi:hypothetical protein